MAARLLLYNIQLQLGGVTVLFWAKYHIVSAYGYCNASDVC